MIRSVLALFMAFSVSLVGLAQTRASLSGVLSLEWGSSRASAKQAFAAKGLYRLVSEDEVYAYFSGSFEGRDANIALGFSRDKLFGCTFSLRGQAATALNDYKATVRNLAAEYGGPTEVVEIFQPPFRQGDGNEIAALKAGKATLQTIWRFGDDNGISVFIDRTNMGTIVLYENKALMAQYLGGLGKR
ncbi:MAG: hypothetical protein WCL50_07740 [Spirochaetota bacterium]